MAEIYVRTTGDDTTGTGLTGAPYASLKKALSVAAPGDVIYMGSGTYAETSGSGYLLITQNFATMVLIEPEPNYALTDPQAVGSVVITGTSGNYSVQLAACSFIQFRNIVFRNNSSTATATMRLLNQSMGNIRFIGCRWDVIGQSSSTNSAIQSVWDTASGGTYTVSKITWQGCEIKQIGAYPVTGVNLDSQLGFVSDLRFIQCKFHVGYFPLRMKGVLDFKLFDLDLASYSSTVPGTCLQIGEDASTGANTTGVINRVKAVALTGHAAVIGAGCSNVTVIDSSFYGGENSSNGQGLVIKNATGVRVTRSVVYGGYLSGLYLKACQNVLVEDVDVYNRFTTSPALRVGINVENNSKVANNTIRGCRFHAPIGTLISWDNSSGDAGGCISDQNGYLVSQAGSWGILRGVSITDLNSLRAAWSGYDQPYNDTNSKVGLQCTLDRGNRSVALL